MKEIKEKRAYGLLAFLASVCAFFGIWWASLHWLALTHIDIEFDNLPNELEGFRILQISDLHNKHEKTMDIDIWSSIAKQEFDIAVITGDLLSHGNMQEFMPHLEGLKQLAKRVPTYFVEGNHDHASYQKLSVLLQNIGVVVVENEMIPYQKNNVRFDILGVRDRYFKTAPTRKQWSEFAQKPITNFRLVLSHQPLNFNYVKQSSPQLMLAGHTHGGQIRLPFLPTLFSPDQGMFPTYGEGLYGKDNSFLYISRGLGSSKIPLRFWNRPQIVIVTLKATSIYSKKMGAI